MIMGNELALRSDRALARQHFRELENVYRRAELADVEVSCVACVTKRAIFTALETNTVRGQAERIGPDGAEHYALLAAVGVTEMAQAIARVRRG
jgi:hypothetical protein